MIMYYVIFHTHGPGAAGTENQGSPLGGQNFEYNFSNKSVSNSQYDPIFIITHDSK